MSQRLQAKKPKIYAPQAGKKARITMSIKITRAIKSYDGFKGQQTVSAVLAQVPEELIQTLTGKQIGQVMSAINKAYHNGRAATGADVIDGDAVWVDKLDNLYDFDILKRLQKRKIEHRLTSIPLDFSDRLNGGHGKWIDGKYYYLSNIRLSNGGKRNPYTNIRNYEDGDLIADGVCREESWELINKEA